MGIVEVTLSMSLDGFITGPDTSAEQPLGTAGNVLRPGGERWMIDEVFAAAGAIAQAKTAASDKNVHIMGGASTVDQALALSLVDMLNLHVEPVPLGGGTRLFADLGRDQIRLERTRIVDGPTTTHLRFRVLR